jgi:phage terminase small subunit
MTKNRLTPKQARFVDEYLVDLNATAAARRAGYSEKTAEVQGPRLLGNVRVAAAIQAALQTRSKRTEVTQDYVVANLREVVERCMQRAPVLAGGEQVVTAAQDGRLATLWCFDGKTAVAALGLLGKHLGMFVEKHEHTGPAGGPVEITITRRVIPAGQ